MYGTGSFLHRNTWALRRALQLSPMQVLCRQLKARGVQLDRMDALELFGADGLRHTVDYARRVRSLEIWEWDERYLPGLRKNFSGAQVKITDTFKEIQATTNTYDFVVADGPSQIVGENREYCGHFELMSGLLFRAVRPSSVIVLNLVPEPLRHIPSDVDNPAHPEYLKRRGEFYGSDHPELIPIEEMIPAYRRAVAANGFNLDWFLTVRRTLRTGVYYLALKVSRI